MTLHRLVFRALLWLYPAGFRRAYGGDMELLFSERLSEQDGVAPTPPILVADHP